MESQRPNNNREDGIIWLLPELEEDRSEPVLEMRRYIKINGEDSGPANVGDFIVWSVFFSPPSGSSKFIRALSRADMRLKNVFSLPSEPSTVNVFHQCPEDEDKDRKFQKIEDKKKEKDKDKDKAKREEKYYYPMPPFGSVDMRIRQYRSGFEQVSRLKHKLMKQEHRPDKVFNLLKDAYDSMNANAGSGPNISFTVSDNAIFKQRTPLGNTVLHLAAGHGNDAMVEKVAQHAPQLFTAINNNCDTALHVAARTGHGSTIKLILNEFLLFARRETNGHGDQSILEMMLMASLTLFRNKQGNPSSMRPL
ncbi:uncharacterized protein LOC114716428 [Neltuma alba]|uniref:uncharacterized protein LOC114716428 n=1 Tax=Neltuma alba TaxID=207710 RepID=UPI0010A56F01|nr:uncharacterized protein LOC114716428 [Prosopis alba]